MKCLFFYIATSAEAGKEQEHRLPDLETSDSVLLHLLLMVVLPLSTRSRNIGKKVCKQKKEMSAFPFTLWLTLITFCKAKGNN